MSYQDETQNVLVEYAPVDDSTPQELYAAMMLRWAAEDDD
jgi:hypothetical protein